MTTWLTRSKISGPIKRPCFWKTPTATAMKQRLDELEAFLDEHQEPVTDYDEGMVRRLIERITVFEDHLEFEFKCGLETEVQM